MLVCIDASESTNRNEYMSMENVWTGESLHGHVCKKYVQVWHNTSANTCLHYENKLKIDELLLSWEQYVV